MVPEHNIYNFR